MVRAQAANSSRRLVSPVRATADATIRRPVDVDEPSRGAPDDVCDVATLRPRAACDERLVPFADAESQRRLRHAGVTTSFWRLANQYEAQSNTCFCGVTSAVMVLNALRVHDPAVVKPVVHFPDDHRAERWLGKDDTPYVERYSQANLFDVPGVAAVKTYDAVLGQTGAPGLALDELCDVLRATGLQVTARSCTRHTPSTAQMKHELVDALGRDGSFVIMNYDRHVLGQSGGGHFSPLGAYDHVSDSFLILDVNATSRSWLWAPARLVLASMRDERGYLLIEEGRRRGAPVTSTAETVFVNPLFALCRQLQRTPR